MSLIQIEFSETRYFLEAIASLVFVMIYRNEK